MRHFPSAIFSFYIGIDCGVDTGIAVWDKRERRLTRVETVKIHEAIELVRDYGSLLAFVRVEDARLRKRIPRYESETRERGRREGAGYVKRDAVIWEDFLTSRGFAFDMVAPKDNKTKMAPDIFSKTTGWQKRTSTHSRDAAMLVFGY